MLITQGGVSGGWALYIRDGRLCFDYNYDGVERYHLFAARPAPLGAKTLVARFDYDGVAGKGLGQGGTLTFFADGARMGEGRLPRTLRGLFAVNEGMDIGADYGSPVGNYPMPFPFKGNLETVHIDLR
jgi:arylsulfatase